jgi:hypothetical protein
MTRSPALLKMGPQEAVIHEVEKDQLWESILRLRRTSSPGGGLPVRKPTPEKRRSLR